MSIPRTSTHRPVAVTMLFLAIILLGSISLTRLPISLLPEIAFPQLIILTEYPNVGPTEVEQRVTRQVEARVAAVPGVDRVTSTSRDGVSLVTLEFLWGQDMDFAMLNAREALDQLRGSLPEGAERPRLLRIDPESDPIMTISVAGEENLSRLKDLAETVFRRRLEQLDGVAEASVTGGLDREIVVEVDPELLEAYGVTISQVSSALDAANQSSRGGTILQGRSRYPLRIVGEFQDVEEIGNVVVAQQAAGGGQGGGTGGGQSQASYRTVRVKDIGRVIDGFEERQAIAHYNGSESVGILVFKESGANTVEVAELVERTIERLEDDYPAIDLAVANSQAGFIADSISNVMSALIYGGILAFLVLFLFLRDPRYPVAVALAIPISVVATFGLMDAADVSLNIMSLGGLALGVGMLVDNSIVVLENIFRHRELGKPMLEAAALGAEEVQGAITASTLTTVAVFGPIVYVEGVAGELFGDLSLAVTFSLLASLVVALTVLPALAARFGDVVLDEVPTAKPAPERPTGFWRKLHWIGTKVVRLPVVLVTGAFRVGKQLVIFWGRSIGKLLGAVFGPPLRAFDRVFDRFADWYHGLLDRALDRRAVVVTVSVLALLGTTAVLVGLDRNLLPQVDQGAFDVRIHLEEGSTLETTLRVASAIENRILQDPDVEIVFARIGRDVRAYAEGDESTGLNTAVLQVRLREHAETEEVLDRVRPIASEYPAAEIAFETGQASALGQILGGAEADMAVRVIAEDLDTALVVAHRVRDAMIQLPNLGNVRIGVGEGQPQTAIVPDGEAAARYDISEQQIATVVEQANRGALATEFVDFDRKIPIMVRLPDERRYSVASLTAFRVNGIPVSELVRVADTIAPTEVNRIEQSRVIPVYADVISGGLDQAVSEVDRALASVERPITEVRFEVGGENEEMRRSFRDLGFAFLLAIVLVYMILAAQFESFVHPFTILVAVPLALVGAVAALALAGQGVNTMSLIGVVILVGIVVNDSIVKVDFIVQAQKAGMPLREAILEAGRVRLRPIIMTTVTTVFGLTPMALGIGRGADLRAPLAIAVIGGLIVATALTLIVIPVVYSLVEEFRLRLAKSRAGETPGAALPSTPAPEAG